MAIKIGEKIQHLRKKNDITQEKMADYLGITAQAISRWENGAGYPDIEMIPAIANYLGVTTDELLCVESAKIEEKIQGFINEYHRLANNAEYHKRFDFTMESYREFPFDFRVMEKYIWQLVYDPNLNYLDEDKRHYPEIERVCNIILDDCTDDKIRYSALSALIDISPKEKAIELAKRFPSSYRDISSEHLEWIHGVYTDEGILQRHYNVLELCDLLTFKICVEAGYKDDERESTPMNTDEKIILLEKAIAIFNIIYEDGDFNFYNSMLQSIYWGLFLNYRDKNDTEKMLDCLEKHVEHSIKYDSMPETAKYTSMMVKGCVLETSTIYKGSPESLCKHNYNFIKKNEHRYSMINETERYKKIMAELEKHANLK